MEEVTQPKIYFRTCIVLLALLALTWLIAYVDLGPFNLIVALGVAISKAIVIALFFMHIKGSSRLLHLAAVAGVIWLLFLISLTLGDYISRVHDFQGHAQNNLASLRNLRGITCSRDSGDFVFLLAA